MTFGRTGREPSNAGFGPSRLDLPYADAALDGFGGAPVIQAKAEPGATHGETSGVSGGGAPLAADVRGSMESSFQTGFADVRVHENGGAESLGALAYTQGNDIHFAAGQYQPDTPQGASLLGHELTHVVQQRDGRVSTPQGKGAPINGDAALEAEADACGERAARGEPAGVVRGGGGDGGGAIQRKKNGEESSETSMTLGHSDSLSTGTTGGEGSSESQSSHSGTSTSSSEDDQEGERRGHRKALKKGLRVVDEAFHAATFNGLGLGLPKLREAAALLPSDFEVDLLSSNITRLADAIEALEPLDMERFWRHDEKARQALSLGDTKEGKRYKWLMKHTGGRSVGGQRGAMEEARATVFDRLSGLRHRKVRQSHHGRKAERIQEELMAQLEPVAARLVQQLGRPIAHVWGNLSREVDLECHPDRVRSGIERMVREKMFIPDRPEEAESDDVSDGDEGSEGGDGQSDDGSTSQQGTGSEE